MLLTPRWTFGCLVLVALPILMVPVTVCGQTSGVQVVDGPVSDEYSELLKLGVEEFSAGNWVEAKVLFTRAHDLRPSARTLRTLGMVEFELRNYPASIRALEIALLDIRNPLTQPQYAASEKLLKQARRYVGTCAVEVEGKLVKLFVDDAPLVLEGGTAQLGVGRHRIRASSPHQPDQVRMVQIRSGATEVVRFSFVEAPPAGDAPRRVTAPQGSPVPAAVSEPIEPAEPVQASMADGGTGVPWGPVALVAGGAALLVGGLITGAAASGLEADLDRLCRGEIPCEPSDPADRRRAGELQDDGDLLMYVTNGLLIASGAVAAGGLVWLVSTGLDGSSRVAVLPAVASDHVGFMVRARL